MGNNIGGGKQSKRLKKLLKEIQQSKSKEFYSLKKFSDDEMHKLIQMLIQAKIKVLELGGGLTDMACMNLAAFLGKKQCTFEELQLQGNNIGDEGVQFLAKALKCNSKLQRLDLSWNQIGDEGAKCLADAVRQSNLRSLDLAYNRFTDVGAAYLYSALRDSKLKRLTLSGNERVSRNTLSQITQALAMVNSKRFDLADALCSARVVDRVGSKSPMKDLPIDLIREIVNAVFGKRR